MKSLITLIMFIFSACSKEDSKDDNLSFNKTSYSGTELKINGYYYSTFKELKYSSATFFYNTGVMKHIGGGSENINDFEVFINDVSNNNWAANIKTGWGLFKIESNVLYYQRWYPKPFGGFFKVFNHECEIVNDSTYILKKQYRVVDGQQTEVTFPNQTFKFVKFDNKPSPTNPYVQ